LESQGFGYQNIHIEFDYRPFPLKLVPSTKTKSNCSSSRLYLSMIKSKTSPILPLFFFLISLLLVIANASSNAMSNPK
jgi:hypothetical protein